MKLDDLFKANKIIILHFNPTGGISSAILARYILSRYYQSVFKYGMQLPSGQKAFVCVDEFQEIADLSSYRWSDNSFLALARQFNAIFLGSAHSLSSLMAKGINFPAVDSFVNNCNTKIIHYTDDPRTAELASRYDPHICLTSIKPGEAFMIDYNADTRQHGYGMETFHNAFDSTKEFINIVREDHSSLEINPKEDKIENLSEWCEVQLKEKQEDHRRQLIQNTLRNPDDEKEFLDFMEENEMENKNLPEGNDSLPSESYRNSLIDDFPELFDDEAIVEIPNGWISYVERALAAFSATGLKTKIAKMSYASEHIEISCAGCTDSRNRYGVGNILSALLVDANSFCAICGSKKHSLDDRFPDEYRDKHNRESPLCKSCLEKFHLSERHTLHI